MSFSGFFSKKLSVLYLIFSLFQRMRILFFFLAFSVFPAEAVKIRFPGEELATESVLPLIEPPQMVLNRNVSLKFRPELGVGMGVGLDEPFYFSFYPTGIIAVHLTENHAISLTGTYFFPRRSSTGEVLSQGGEGFKKFDPLKAPYPQMSAFMNYQYTPYYGKISLAKHWVLNLSIYGFTGLGLVVSNQNNQLFAGNFGIGQKLYINKWLGIRGDLGFYGYYGPAIAKLKLDDSVGVIDYTQLQSDKKRFIINVVVNVGVILLI